MKFFEKNADTLYFLFRVIVGVGFFLHGLMKLPGIFDGSTAFFSLMWFAGIIETVGGVFLVIGLFVKWTALIGALEMAVAFFYMHVAKNGTLNPLANRGEAAMLYFAAFLVFLGYGAGKWAFDKQKKKSK